MYFPQIFCHSKRKQIFEGWNDLILIVIPTLFASLHVGIAHCMIAFSLCLALGLVILTLSTHHQQSQTNDNEVNYSSSSIVSPSWSWLTLSRFSSLSTVRASLLLYTSISILAVDFPVYPREYAKTESFGVSLVRLELFSISLLSSFIVMILSHFCSLLPDTHSICLDLS